MNYPIETLDSSDDDGTMPDNVDELRKAVVGHRIIRAEKTSWDETSYWGHTYTTRGFEIELDNGKVVRMTDGSDCCAYTELHGFLLNADRIDHLITGVGTTDGYETWHVYADMGDVLELSVGWSCGNPFYYAYGFTITVQDKESK